MGELKLSAKLRMMAKGAFTRGDVISADRLSRAAIEHDSLVDQLAAAKAEIAELVDVLDKLLDEARGSADQVHHEFGLGEQVYDKSITTAEKLLAKHKGE